MGHNINFNENTGKHSFFSVQQKAWHGLGQTVKDYPTSEQAMRFAGLDYEVVKQPLFTLGNEGPQDGISIPELAVPDHYATVRTDTDQVLGVVGESYQVVQNREAFSFFDTIVDGEGILYETAGALGKGERIFITAKLPGYIRVGSDDLVEKYIFLTTSHDGMGSITAAFTPVRIVCNNTLNAAMKNHTNCVKIRHTASASERLKQAHKLMGISNALADELEGLFNNWTSVRITDKEVKRLIQMALAPNRETLANLQKGREEELSTCFKNMVDGAFTYAMSNETQQLATTKGTLFGAYNAVTGYFQNVRNFKDKEAKYTSIMSGTGKLRAQSAFSICNEFAQNGKQALFLN